MWCLGFTYTSLLIFILHCLLDSNILGPNSLFSVAPFRSSPIMAAKVWAKVLNVICEPNSPCLAHYMEHQVVILTYILIGKPGVVLYYIIENLIPYPTMFMLNTKPN